jgi:transposase
MQMSDQEYLFKPIPHDKYDTLSRADLKILIEGQEDLIQQLRKLNDSLLKEVKASKEQAVQVQEQLLVLKSKFFGRSSEKAPSDKLKQSHYESQKDVPAKARVQLPSLRYPNVPLIERDIELSDIPNCNCCNQKLSDSGMTEDSERLTVIPKKFIIERLKRHIYRCDGCHSELITAPSLPRVKEGSSYGDELMIDVAVAKYDYLLPIQRYVRMAEDLGVDGIPPQSLIETTHYLADFLEPLYEGIKTEVQAAEVLHADETPHRMLEGDKKKNWYLWGFSTKKSSYFELHSTRSGDVASGFLLQSKCTHLMSDVFSGYKKAVTDANAVRTQSIEQLYCNAHARRKFKEAEDSFATDSAFFVKNYERIYFLNGLDQSRSHEVQVEMQGIFNQMRDHGLEIIVQYPEKSSIGKALGYFLKNFNELTKFAKSSTLPIDNNSQERQMRNPVIGRKTWYGTHSKRGAKTAAILFSIIESCKLNGINSNEYIEAQVKRIHSKLPIITPALYTPTTTH